MLNMKSNLENYSQPSRLVELLFAILPHLLAYYLKVNI